MGTHQMATGAPTEIVERKFFNSWYHGEPVLWAAASATLQNGKAIPRGALGFVLGRAEKDQAKQLMCWFESCPGGVRCNKGVLGFPKDVNAVKALVREELCTHGIVQAPPQVRAPAKRSEF